MTVSREQLEVHLEKVRALVRDPRQGLYGPSSMVWRVNREQLLFLAGTRAALLQEAHPFVAHGVDQHSATKSDPFGRFERTFKHVHAMIFGELDSALASARRVHAFHQKVRGTIGENSGAYAKGAPYQANDEQALLWVHATLWESSITAYELFFRPLSGDEKERYYQETKLFAYLFGIPEAVLPPTFPDFSAYNERMWRSNDLAVASVAREMAAFILSPANPLQRRLTGWNRIMTAGLLPERFREAYGLSFGAKERAAYEMSVRALRALWPLVPRQIRFVPAYLLARRRLGLEVVPTIGERLVARMGQDGHPGQRATPAR
jgi:uncharacterized protein (DUF2236 family)